MSDIIPDIKETSVRIIISLYHKRGLQASLIAQLIKNLPAMQETQIRFLGWKDPPGEGNDNPFQYSCLENPMDRGAWRATVHGLTRVKQRLSD